MKEALNIIAISNFLNINMLYQESINEMKEHENDLEEAKPENNLGRRGQGACYTKGAIELHEQLDALCIDAGAAGAY